MKKPSRRETIQNANDAARAALAKTSASTPSDHLGDLTWWDLTAGWRESVSTVEAVLLQHGVDPVATLPASPDWTTAFGRAVQSLRTTIRPEGYTLLDAAVGPDGERRVAIVSIARNGKVSTSDEGTVTCPKDGAPPIIERDDPSGIAQRIVAKAYTFHGVYISDDIRAAVTKVLLRWAAMPCRQAPPHIVYWLPSTGASEIRKLADAVEALGWGRIELFAGYASDPRSARAAVNAVNEGLEARLTAFAAEAAQYAERDPKKTRPSTIESKLEDAKRLRAQADLYRTILGAAVVGIDQRVALVERALKETLGIVEAAHAA